jgi:hypothetical protein
MTAATSGATAVLVVTYDLRAPDAWGEACRHGRVWGRLYTDIHTLDADHIALVFRPADDERWRDWERVRLEWLQETAA